MKKHEVLALLEDLLKEFDADELLFVVTLNDLPGARDAAWAL
jgi:hypothetical protein